MRLAGIFLGFDGEVNNYGQGTPSVFIRFAGCNLSCTYCDTKKWQSMQSGGKSNVETVFDLVQKGYGDGFLRDAIFKKVTITGGEPLLQYYEFWELTKLLDNENWIISVETNGSMPLIHPTGCNRVNQSIDSWIVDYKLPSSGMMDCMMPIKGFSQLQFRDYIKFVIEDDKDLAKAFEIQKKIQNDTECRARFAYSPCWGKMPIEDLADKLLSMGSSEILGNCILNYQLHKLWKDPEPEKKIKK